MEEEFFCGKVNFELIIGLNKKICFKEDDL